MDSINWWEVGPKTGGRLSPKSCGRWEVETPATPHTNCYNNIWPPDHEGANEHYDSLQCVNINCVYHMLSETYNILCQISCQRLESIIIITRTRTGQDNFVARK